MLKQLELKIPPLALWAVLALATAGGAFFAPGVNFPFPGHRQIAIALVLAGLLVVAAGVLAFRRARTTVNPLVPGRATAVVRVGLYRFTRNPMYLGMALALAGLALWWASLPGLAWVAVFCAWVTRFQIWPEERALLARFGDEFVVYMSQVPRWL